MATIQCGDVSFAAIEAVVFDKDGTLANSQEYLRNLGQKRARLIDAQIPGVQEPLLMAFGLDARQLNPAGLLAVGTRLENEIAAAAYVAETGRDWVESLSLVRSAFAEVDSILKRKADSTPLFDGALALLQALAGVAVPVCLLSADSTVNVQDFIDRYQLGSLVQVGMGMDTFPGKPDPSALLQLCKTLGVSPSRVLVIGDAVADLVMARSAGAAGCVGVTWGWTMATSLTQADALVASFTEIRAIA